MGLLEAEVVKQNSTDLSINNPIWDSFDEPSIHEVGNVISLACGHAARPSETEALSFHTHLIEGGFIGPPDGWATMKGGHPTSPFKVTSPWAKIA